MHPLLVTHVFEHHRNQSAVRTRVFHHLFVLVLAGSSSTRVTFEFAAVFLLEIREIAILVDYTLADLAPQKLEGIRIEEPAPTDQANVRLLFP